MGWKRFKEMEKNGILGWWEHEENTSMITLTKGHAHIVHKGMAATVLTPESDFSSNPNTIGRLVAKRLGLIDAATEAFD